MQTRIPAALMCGGTSKGLYFLASDLPAEPALRDRVPLAAMGSADLRQIDGVGRADPLTGKVAIVVRAAVTVATAAAIEGSVTHDVARLPPEPRRMISVEHPSGEFSVELEAEGDAESLTVSRAALLRTARRLLEGNVLIPRHVWDGRPEQARSDAPR